MSESAEILPQKASFAPRFPIEILPKWAFTLPLVLQWLWLSLRYRSLTLPSCVNPSIETGGLVGESKLACLALIGADHRDWVAQIALVSPGQSAEQVRQ